jgi:hypothetical protein
MKKLMNFLMLSCKKAAGLIEKKLHFPLDPMEKFQLMMHKSMCEACRNYEKQSVAMDAILNKNSKIKEIDTAGIELSDEFKNQLISDLKNK